MVDWLSANSWVEKWWHWTLSVSMVNRFIYGIISGKGHASCDLVYSGNYNVSQKKIHPQYYSFVTWRNIGLYDDFENSHGWTQRCQTSR